MTKSIELYRISSLDYYQCSNIAPAYEIVYARETNNAGKTSIHVKKKMRLKKGIGIFCTQNFCSCSLKKSEHRFENSSE